MSILYSSLQTPHAYSQHYFECIFISSLSTIFHNNFLLLAAAAADAFARKFLFNSFSHNKKNYSWFLLCLSIQMSFFCVLCLARKIDNFHIVFLMSIYFLTKCIGDEKFLSMENFFINRIKKKAEAVIIIHKKVFFFYRKFFNSILLFYEWVVVRRRRTMEMELRFLQPLNWVIIMIKSFEQKMMKMTTTTLLRKRKWNEIITNFCVTDAQLEAVKVIRWYFFVCDFCSWLAHFSCNFDIFLWWKFFL